jgi:pSer/pThr/pTyr-binding forkhead associated (FHA) protein
MGDTSLNLFRAACGLTGPLRLEVAGRGEDAGERRLEPPFAVVGRDARADVFLDHDEVSKRHAYLQVIAGRVFCVDLGSRSGVRWEGQGRPSGWVDVGRSIGIGPYHIRVGDCDPSAPRTATGPTEPLIPLPPPLPGPDALPAVILEALNVKDRLPWRVNSMLALIGRSPDCQVHIPEQFLSRVHCGLLRTPLGVWAVELLGQEGVQVNGHDARFARLDDGDQLRVGSVLFRVRYGPDGRPGLPVRAGATALAPPTTRRPPRRTGLSLPRVLPSAPGDRAATDWVAPTREPEVAFVERPADPFAELVIQQLGQMQQQIDDMRQQTIDQFQQVLMAVLQTVGTMHRDQLGVVQEELVQVRRLTQELQALSPGPREAKTGAGLLLPDPRRTLQAPRRPAEHSERTTHAPPRNRPGRGTGTTTADHGTPRRVPPAEADSVARQPAQREGLPATDGAAASSDEHMHDVLSQRIAELQHERQSRWQKVLNMIGIP